MRIKLTQNKYAVVDDENYQWLNQYKWRIQDNHTTYYARRNIIIQNPNKQKNIKRKRKIIYMHRIILEKKLGRQLEKSEFTDHINGDGLDNRECNLRLCTSQQNKMNQKKTRGSSMYKGVRWVKRDKKWRTTIQFNKKKIHLGIFQDEAEAALAYNEAALKYFGEFARLNII